MIFETFQKFLEKIDDRRNQFLYFLIKPFWPRKILPNYITWFRIFLGLWLCLMLFWFRIEDKQIVLFIFFIGIITDFIDGPVARHLNKTTEFGAMLDPLADRILIMPIAIYSLFKFHKWLLLWLILIEFLGMIIFIFIKSKNLSSKSNIFGKAKMVIQSLVFLVILFFWPNPPFIFFIDVLWLTIPLSLLSILNKIAQIQSSKLNKIIISKK